MSIVLRPYQQDGIRMIKEEWLKGNKRVVVVYPTGCHEAGYPIRMFDGTTKYVQDVAVGDKIMGGDGNKRTVLSLHRGHGEMFKITPAKGEPFIVNGGHILSLYKTNEGKKQSKNPKNYVEISVSEYITKSNNFKHLHKLYKPSCFVYASSATTLPIEPYFLGIYLGDGSTANRTLNITTMRDEVRDYIYSYSNSLGLSIRCEKRHEKSICRTYYIRGAKNSYLKKALKELDLFRHKAGEKFIPLEYLASSVDNRLNLLAGLLDTDAYYSGACFEYCSKSFRLASDVVSLCHSLGFAANIGKTKVVKGVEYYRLTISGSLERIPTKVPIRIASARRQKKSVLVTGFSVEPAGIDNYYGFTIDGDHLYCDYQGFVHHNSGKTVLFSYMAQLASKKNSRVLVITHRDELLGQTGGTLRDFNLGSNNIRGFFETV